MFKKILSALILFSFLILNTQSEAKEKSLPLGIMVLKETPLLFVDMVKITPVAFIPLTNAYVAETNQVYNESEKRSKVEYVKYREELLYGKQEEKKETSEPSLILEDKPLSNPIIYEAENLDSDIIKKIIFDSKNSSIESYDLISKGLKDGNYLKYSSLFDYSIAKQTLKNKEGKRYDFSDSYNTFLLLNQNGYSDEDIKKVVNQTTTLKPFDDLYHGYKYKEKQTKLIIDNKKISQDKKIDKIISKNKTNYEKIRQTPVLGAIEQTGEALVLAPAVVGVLGVGLAASLTVIPASIYTDMTRNWYNNLKTIRNCDLKLLELDNKELELKEKNID